MPGRCAYKPLTGRGAKSSLWPLTNTERSRHGDKWANYKCVFHRGGEAGGRREGGFYSWNKSSQTTRMTEDLRLELSPPSSSLLRLHRKAEKAHSRPPSCVLHSRWCAALMQLAALWRSWQLRPPWPGKSRASGATTAVM